MHYLVPLLSALALAPLPVAAINRSAADCTHADRQLAQSQCVHLVSWTSPDLLRCQQVGTNNLGVPIWLCC